MVFLGIVMLMTHECFVIPWPLFSVVSFSLTVVTFLFSLGNWFSQICGFGSIDLKRMQADNLINVVPPTSRSTNYIALRFFDFPSEISVRSRQLTFCIETRLIFKLQLGYEWISTWKFTLLF